MNAVVDKTESKGLCKDKISIMALSLAFFFFVVPMEFFPVLQGFSLLRMLVFLPVSASLFRVREMIFKYNSLIILNLLLLVWMLITYFYSISGGDTLSRIFSNVQFLVLFFCCVFIPYNKREIVFLKRSFALSGLLTIILMIVFGVSEYGRITIIINGIRQDQNGLCGFFIFPIVYLIENCYKANVRKKVFSIGAIAVCLYFALMTGSRGVMLAVIAASLIYMVFYSANSMSLKNLLGFIIIITIGCFIFYILMDIVPLEIKKRFSLDFTMKDNGAGRFEIWKSIFEIFNGSGNFRKFFGYGLGTIRYLLDSVAHNLALETLLESGIIGLVIMYTMYVSYIIKAYKAGDILIFSVMSGYMVMSMSLSLYNSKIVWNIMILTAIICLNHNNQKNARAGRFREPNNLHMLSEISHASNRLRAFSKSTKEEKV